MEEFMKKNLLFSVVMLLMATLFIAVMPTEAEGAVYEDTVRLHILAPSDSKEDQALKLTVRDAVLDKFGRELSSYGSAKEAAEELIAVLPEIEALATKIASDFGYDATATLEREWFETREYGEYTLHAGEYLSLRIIIGEGRGQNWWCVMFPPLCLDVATESTPCDDAIKKYSDEEFVLITGEGYRAKFKILELISTAFS